MSPFSRPKNSTCTRVYTVCVNQYYIHDCTVCTAFGCLILFWFIIEPLSRVLSLHMSPIDDTFISGSLDRTLRLWDLRSPNCQVLQVTHYNCPDCTVLTFVNIVFWLVNLKSVDSLLQAI